MAPPNSKSWIRPWLEALGQGHYGRPRVIIYGFLMSICPSFLCNIVGPRPTWPMPKNRPGCETTNDCVQVKIDITITYNRVRLSCTLTKQALLSWKVAIKGRGYLLNYWSSMVGLTSIAEFFTSVAPRAPRRMK